MANTDGLETVLPEEETVERTTPPSRASKKGESRIAKLTKRTIDSLRRVIGEEGRLDRAFKKYNSKYSKMRKRLDTANQTRVAFDNGEKTQSQVYLAYERVTYYDKKLAKYGVRLLLPDIKELAHARARGKAKPLKVPKFLAEKFPKITSALAAAYDSMRTRKVEKSLVRELKKGTRENIKNSLNGALIADQDARVLTERPDAAIIQGLKVDEAATTFEERIANIRRFISSDGKTSIYGEETIGATEPQNIDVPPPAPTSTVPEEEVAVTEKSLLGGLAKPASAPVAEESTEKKGQTPTITENDLIQNLGGKPPVSSPVTPAAEVPVAPATEEVPEEKQNNEPVSSEVTIKTSSPEDMVRREKEFFATMSTSLTILQDQLANTNDPNIRTRLEGLIKDLRAQMDGYIKTSTSTTSKTSTKEPVNTDARPLEQIIDEVSSLEPIEVPEVLAPATETPTEKPPKSPVSITDAPSGRVAQNGTPSTLIVTPQTIAEMQRRNAAAEARIKTTTSEIEALREQKAMLEQYIQVANATRDNERTADQLAEERAALTSDVAALTSDADAISSELGSNKRLV